MEAIETGHQHINDDDCSIIDVLVKEYGKNNGMPEEDEKFFHKVMLAIEQCADCKAHYKKFHGLHLQR